MLLALFAAAAVTGSAPVSTNSNVWEWAQDYVRQEGATGAPHVRIELTVDANGSPIHCTILQSDEAKGFDDRYCLVPMRRAHFKPARDENGEAVAGVFSTNFQVPAFSHGNGGWTDFTLTVSGLPAGRSRTVVARVVTDVAGHVESCAIETPSGIVRLDEAACRYTRASLSLAPPFDRDGRPVRAMRLVSIGFSTAPVHPVVP